MPSHFIIGLGATCTAILAIVALALYIKKGMRRVGHIIDEVVGSPQEGHRAARPGWGERLDALDRGQLHIIDQITGMDTRMVDIEEQFHPDHGFSMHDRVERIEHVIRRIDRNGWGSQ